MMTEKRLTFMRVLTTNLTLKLKYFKTKTMKEFNQFEKWFTKTYENKELEPKEQKEIKQEREYNSLDSRYSSFGKKNNY